MLHKERVAIAALFLWSTRDVDLFLIRYANTLHSIPLGGPPGPLSPSGFAPIRSNLRYLGN